MKKVLLIGAIALFGAANAQTEKGTWMVSGKSEISFNSVNTSVKFDGTEVAEDETSSFTFAPSAGYFVINDLAVGLGLNYAHSKNDDVKSDTFVVMPQATYFFATSGNIKPYVEAGIGYGFNKTSDDDSEAKADGLAYGAGLGVAYFVNPSVAFNLGLNYSGANLKFSEDSNLETDVNTLGVGVGISVFLK